MKTAEFQTGESVLLKSILFATDLSPASAAAFAYAAGMARAHHGKIETVHVIPSEARTAVPLDPIPLTMDREWMQGEAVLKQLAGGSLLERVEHKELLKRGNVMEVLLDLIEQENPDLLVMGTHARTGVKKLFLGSVAEELFRLAPCPVLTVGPRVEAKAVMDGQPQTILFATDFGPASLHALPYALALANESHGKLVLLHVIPPVPTLDIGPYWYPGTDLEKRQDADREKTMARLWSLVPDSGEPQCIIEPQVSFNLMPGAILQASWENAANSIVMGVKSSQIASAHTSARLPWATAHEVVCHAHCPVLTVRA